MLTLREVQPALVSAKRRDVSCPLLIRATRVKILFQQILRHSVVADQYGCPTYAGDIATAILRLLTGNAPAGIYHYCGDKSVSWAEFAQAIFVGGEKCGVLTTQPKVNFITTAQYPTQAQRPAYSVLSTEKVSDFRLAGGFS